MPRIVDYTATGDLKPQDRGIDAFVRSGRYVGTYYRQTAQDMSEQGKLQSAEIRERAWPFDILGLEQQALADKTGGNSGGLSRRNGSSGGGGGGGGSGGGGGGSTSSHAPHAQTSRAASALGRVASDLSSGYAPSGRGHSGGAYNPGTGMYEDGGGPARDQWAQQVQQAQQMDRKRQRGMQALADRQWAGEQASLDAYHRGIAATADTDAQQLQNWYRKYTGDPNAGIPTDQSEGMPGINAPRFGQPGSNYDVNGNPIGGDFSPANDPSQDTSFGGYVVNKLQDWASDVASVFSGDSRSSAPSMSSGDPSSLPAPPDESGVQY